MSEDERPLPAPTLIARSLDRARKGQLLYVGNDGEVRSPESLRARNVLAYGLIGGVTVSGIALAAVTFPPIIPLYVVLGGRFAASANAIPAPQPRRARRWGEANSAAAQQAAEPVAPGLVATAPRAGAGGDPGGGGAGDRWPGRAGAAAAAARARSAVGAQRAAPQLAVHRGAPAGAAGQAVRSADGLHGDGGAAAGRGAEGGALAGRAAPGVRRGQALESTRRRCTSGRARGWR